MTNGERHGGGALDMGPCKVYVERESPRVMCIDETSYTKGQNYITVVVDHDTGCVIWVHEKHGKDILKLFLEGCWQIRKVIVLQINAEYMIF